MATKIEWVRNSDGTAGESWNPIRARRKSDGKVGWFCTKVSTGCTHCYSERRNNRMGTRLPYIAASLDEIEIFLDEKVLERPLHWRKPRTVFVCSMTDLFHESVPMQWIDKVFEAMAWTPERPHTYQVLTKRPRRMLLFLEYYWCRHVPDNIWLGTSVESQTAADERREYLRQCQADVKFVSYEPSIAAVDWDGWEFVDQIIGGGESGPGARPSHPDWHRGTRDWCQEQRPKVKYFFKQWGRYKEIQFDKRGKGDVLVSPTRGVIDHLPDPYEHPDEFKRTVAMRPVGKKAAGRILDGRTWSEMPGQAQAQEEEP